MSKEALDLYSLFLSNDSKAIKVAVKQLEKDHQLDKMLQTLVLMCKKVKINSSINPVMIPYIRKHFSTLPSTRAKTLAEELLGVCDSQHSPRACAVLLRHLTETVQLGNALKFREIVKTSFVKVHNSLRKTKKASAASDLVIAIFNVLMFEYHLQDNVQLGLLKEVWSNIDVPEESAVYHFATYVLYLAFGLSAEAYGAEIELCKLESLSDETFIQFCEPYLHIPLAHFEPDNASNFLNSLLPHYVVNDKIDHFCSLIFSTPELRSSSRFIKIENSIISFIKKSGTEKQHRQASEILKEFNHSDSASIKLLKNDKLIKDGPFCDIEKLRKLITLPDGEELLKTIFKDFQESDIMFIRKQILETYNLEKLSECEETRNQIFIILTNISKTRFSVSLIGLEDFVYSLFTDSDCISAGAMNFAEAYMHILKGSKRFADFASIFIFTASNLLASQKLFPLASAALFEIKRTLAVVKFLKYIADLPPKIGIMAQQFPIIGRMISKLVTDLTTYRRLINKLAEKEKYLKHNETFSDLVFHYDHFHKQLSNLTKAIINLKNGYINRQLPFVISNSLTGEREGNLPTFNLLSGCDEASISFLSTALPLIEKRRFAAIYPSFVESNRFTG